jgi:hypothetical protein
VYLDVFRRTRRQPTALSAGILFASSTLIARFPIAKTYSLAGLLLFAAYLAVDWKRPAYSRRMVVIGGVMLGLSI